MTKEELQKLFEKCLHPIKSQYRFFCTVSGIIFLILIYSHPPNNIKATLILILGSIIGGFLFCLVHIRQFYDDLDSALEKFYQTQSDYFDKHAVTTTEIIDDFTMFYDDCDVEVSFSYQDKPQSISVDKDSLPHPYDNQIIVIVARHHILPVEKRNEYEELFSLCDFYQTYSVVVKKREYKSLFVLYKQEYQSMAEPPAIEKTEFKIAVMNKPYQSNQPTYKEDNV